MRALSALPSLRRLLFVLALLLAAAPTAVQGAGVPLGPDGGTIPTLAFAPSDPRVVYAGTLGGGVFASGDGGRSWRRAAGTPGELAGRDVSALAVDPRDSRVVYAGTAQGVWKTASGGDGWVAFPHRLAVPVLALAVDPGHRQVVYAGTEQGVFRSDDGGRHWVARSAGLPAGAHVLALDVDPAVPGRVFAGVSLSLAGLYVSQDGGASWSKVEGGLPSFDFWGGFARVSGTLYVAGSSALYRSDDDGATWSRPPGTDQLLSFPRALTADAAGTLYVGVGGLGVQATSDRGASFSYLGDTDPNGVIRPFGEVWSLAAAPGVPGRVLAGTRARGVFRRAGATFVASRRGLSATFITGFDVDRGNPAHLYASDLLAGIFESRDAGATWQSRNQGLPVTDQLPLFGIQALTLHPRNPALLYTGFESGIARSSDGGASWSFTEINECSTPTAIAVDPRAPVIYAGIQPVILHGCTFACFAFVSRDGGQSWSCLPGISQLLAVLVTPGRSEVVYVAGDHGVWKSTDRGLSFTKASQGLGPGDVISLGISQAAPQVIYAGELAGGVSKSVDGAAHWVATGAPTGPVVGLAVDPTNADRVYAAVYGAGLFASRDGGATWQPLGPEVPAVLSGPLKIVGSGHGPRTLYVGTAGSGAWAVAVP